MPHRDEESDTVAFLIQSGMSLLYAPDFDSYNEVIDRLVRSSDLAILDGCFYSTNELGDRSRGDIQHPTIRETRDRFRGHESKIVFTHLNHTNPVLKISGDIHQCLLREGFTIAKEGMILQLG